MTTCSAARQRIRSWWQFLWIFFLALFWICPVMECVREGIVILSKGKILWSYSDHIRNKEKWRICLYRAQLYYILQSSLSKAYQTLNYRVTVSRVKFHIFFSVTYFPIFLILFECSCALLWTFNVNFSNNNFPLPCALSSLWLRLPSAPRRVVCAA